MHSLTLTSPSPQLRPISHTARVFVIESDVTLRRLFDQSLRRSGFDTFSGAVGKSVTESIKAVQPDIVLMDFDFLDVNALDLIYKIKTHSGTHPPAIIALSDRDRYHYHVAEDVAYFFSKPVRIITLLDLLRRISSNRMLHREC